jgi:uncharacterized protein YjbJ (UPF0337 family)
MMRLTSDKKRRPGMNADIFGGTWKELRGEMRNRWGELTNDDLEQIRGERDRLVGFIQKKYGRTRQQAEGEVDEFLTRYDGFGQARQRVQQTWSNVRDRAQGLGEQIPEDLPAKARETVEENPVATALIGATIVFLILLLWQLTK